MRTQEGVGHTLGSFLRFFDMFGQVRWAISRKFHLFSPL